MYLFPQGPSSLSSRPPPRGGGRGNPNLPSARPYSPFPSLAAATEIGRAKPGWPAAAGSIVSSRGEAGAGRCPWLGRGAARRRGVASSAHGAWLGGTRRTASLCRRRLPVAGSRIALGLDGNVLGPGRGAAAGHGAAALRGRATGGLVAVSRQIGNNGVVTSFFRSRPSRSMDLGGEEGGRCKPGSGRRLRHLWVSLPC